LLAHYPDIKIVKEGKVHYESRQPGKWKDVQTSLSEGATVVMHNLQTRHEPIHRLCAELEDELEIFLGANSYLTPAGSTGFDPHYDWHDILVLQLEGTKTWTVCEQRDVDLYQYRKGGGKRIFQHGEDFGNCTELVFRPGDLFYAPFGTIHYAKTNTTQDKTDNDPPEQHSMHLTFSLIRQQFTWGQFLQDIVESRTEKYSSVFSALVASNTRLQSQIPTLWLHDIAYSIGNADLPPSFIEKFRSEAKSIVKEELSSNTKLRALLLSLLDRSNGSALEDTVELFRVKMVLGRLKEKQRCPSSNNIGDDISTMSFRRFPHQRMMLDEIEDYAAIVVTGTTEEEQIPLPLKWSHGLRYALGGSGVGRGKFFTIDDLIVKVKMKRVEAVAMIEKLIKACLLDWRIDNGSSTLQQMSSKENEL
jgi:hypothetical protein